MKSNLRLTVLMIGLLSMVVVGGCLLKKPDPIEPPEEPPEFLLAPQTLEHQNLIDSLKGKDLVFIFQPEIGKLEEVDARIMILGKEWGDVDIMDEPFSQHKDNFSAEHGLIAEPARNRWACVCREGSVVGAYYIDYRFENSKINDADKIVIAAEMYKYNANQYSQIFITFDGWETWTEPESLKLQETYAWFSLNYEMPLDKETDQIIVRWAFLKPDPGDIWTTGLSNLFVAGYKE